MHNSKAFYIDGQWVAPESNRTLDVINPADESVIDSIAMGNEADVNKAVAAAKRAFPTFSTTSRAERVELLDNIVEVYQRRMDEVAEAISLEMGAPREFATRLQAPRGMLHFSVIRDILKNYAFSEERNTTRITKEAVGVCGLITPWNWPMNQMACKVGPALAAGCTMVLKPSEIAPFSALLLAQIIDEAGVPAGVFNLINGDGPVVGNAMSAHPDIDMMSFTGSTRAGIEVARTAADTVKRVAQELGGKSANIILDDADLDTVIERDVRLCMSNSGQSCNSPTRMLVPRRLQDKVVEIARRTATSIVAGDPEAAGTNIGPVVSGAQWDKIQGLISKGVEEGATLVCGGTGKPNGIEKGYYVQPTVFSDVNNEMTIAREEIFGPVLSILPYENEDEAVRIANDTVYGLASYISSGDLDRARSVAGRIRAGMVHLNGSPITDDAGFGGYKQSGNGREWGEFGLEEFLETKSILGYSPA